LARAWKFGDDVNTDEIIPATALATTDSSALAHYCMAPIRPGFADLVKHGDVIVAGANFGCGSSREHAPLCISGLGISCVIAKTFARIFFRNSINTGLPIVQCPEAAEEISEGDELKVDLAKGAVTNLTTRRSYSFEPLRGEVGEIIRAGGLMNYVKSLLDSR